MISRWFPVKITLCRLDLILSADIAQNLFSSNKLMPLEKYIQHVFSHLFVVCSYVSPNLPSCCLFLLLKDLCFYFLFIYIYMCAVINIIDHAFLSTQVFCLNVLSIPSLHLINGFLMCLLFMSKDGLFHF